MSSGGSGYSPGPNRLEVVSVETEAKQQQQHNRIDLCVKALSKPPKNHLFNVKEKVKTVVQWAVNEFGLEPHPARPYIAYLEQNGKLTELRLDLSIEDQHIGTGSCIVISTPQNVDG